MATELSQSPATNQFDGFVDNQLEKTRSRIKIVDLCTGIFSMVAWTLGVLLLLAVVDAWIWSLGKWGRLFGLVILLGGAVAIGLRFVLPLLLRKINPRYAARMIEQSKPSFKNSLLNYLWLRREPKASTKVHEAMAQKAAADINGVTANESVDQSYLIRSGFMVVGLAIMIVAYSFASPKNPIPTFLRVLSPFSDISKPAIARVERVEPGDVEVFFGDKIHVTAIVKGRHEPGDVQLVYSTEDGQFTDVTLGMLHDGGYEYSCELSPTSSGIQQNLKYKVVVLDGESPWYEVSVKSLPAVTIEEIKIEPPAYTGLPERTITGTGEISGHESSKVIVYAKANLPVEMAHIEFLRQNENSENYRIVKTELVEAEQNKIICVFYLQMNSERTGPLFTHYQIKFSTTTGEKNSEPNVYPIKVIPDLAPEIEIIEPRNLEISIPENGSLPVIVKAIDLDFELTALQLNIDNRGQRTLNYVFPIESGTQDAQVSHWIVPEKIGLRAGDKAIMFATAADNRHSAFSQTLVPNVSRTQNYTLTITEPDPSIDEEKRDEEIEQAQKEEQQQQNPEQSEQENQEQNEEKGSASDEQESGAGENEEPENQTGEMNEEEQNPDNQEENPQQGENENESGSDEGKTENGNQENEENQNSDNQNETGSQSEEQSQDNQEQNSEGGSNQQEQNTGEQSQTGENSSSTGNAENNSDQESEQDATGNGENNEKANPESSSDGNSEGGDGSNDSSNAQSNEEGNPSESNGNDDGQRDDNLQSGQQMNEETHDSDRMEELKKYIEEKQKEQKQSGNKSNNQSENNQNQDPSNDQGQNENSSGDNAQEQNNQNTGNQENEQNTSQESSNNTGSNDSEQSDQKGSESKQNGTESNQEKGTGQNSEEGNPENQSNESENKANSNEEGSQNDDTSSSDQGENGSENSMNQNNDSEGTSENGNQDQGQGESDNQEGGSNSESSDSSDNQQSGNSNSNEGSNEQNSQSGSQESNANNAGESSQSTGEGSGNKGADGSTSQGEDAESNNRQNAATQKGDGTNPAGNNNRDFEQAERDKANLDFAKEATDLVLEELRNQANNPDQELLDRMNWTEEQLKDFLQRWEKMKDAADSGDIADQKRYESKLKSLGLRPNDPAGQKIDAKRDQEFGLSEDGAVNRASAEHAEAYKEYLKLRNKAER